MSTMYLVYGLVPLVVFVIVSSFASLKWAVIAAIAFAIADVFVSYAFIGSWDPGLVISTFLILGCGYGAVRLNNPLVMKLQPVALSVILAATLFYFQFLSVPLLTHYKPVLQKMFPPEQQHLLDNQALFDIMNTITNWCIPLLLLHGAMVAYAAYRCSNVVWILTRAFGFWIMFIIMGFVMIAMRGSEAIGVGGVP